MATLFTLTEISLKFRFIPKDELLFFSLLLFSLFLSSPLPVSLFYFHHKAAHLKGQPHCTPLIIKWPFPQLPVPSISTHIRVPLRSPLRGRLVGPSSAPVTCVLSSSPAATHQRTHLPPCLPTQIWICPLENMPFQARWQYTSMIKTKWWHPNLRAYMPF